ncbi:MAG: PIN domain-containing protein [Verrucomicrobiae bacterium]|nr:PIN domain-containing protein [Verrucomicrobiae bacterium]
MDTNVLYAALRSRSGASFAVVEALRRGKWRLLLSNTVLAEYEEVLKREATALQLAPAEIDSLLDALCALAERMLLTGDWTPLLTDADDEAFAQLAVEAGADCLVSHNLRHLEPVRRLGVKLLEPREFLGILPA